MKTADQPLQRPPAALTRSSCRAEWIGTAQDGASQQAPRTDVDASAELSDREKFVRALSRDSAEGAPRGGNRESSGVMRRRQVKRLGYQAHHIRSLHFRIYLPVTRFGCGDSRRRASSGLVRSHFSCQALRLGSAPVYLLARPCFCARLLISLLTGREPLLLGSLQRVRP